jgi:hypothetical protein
MLAHPEFFYFLNFLLKGPSIFFYDNMVSTLETLLHANHLNYSMITWLKRYIKLIY